MDREDLETSKVGPRGLATTRYVRCMPPRFHPADSPRVAGSIDAASMRFACFLPALPSSRTRFSPLGDTLYLPSLQPCLSEMKPNAEKFFSERSVAVSGLL